MLRDSVHRRTRRRIAVVGELVLQRRRAEDLLATELGVEVVYSCSSIRRFISWLRDADRARWPHLLVLGLLDVPDSREDVNALDALRAAGMRVLILSAPTSRTGSRRFSALDVDGIVSAADSETVFVAAADTVLSGGTIVTSRAQAMSAPPLRPPRLSIQEERVLALYASGRTITQTADEIGVRHDTARKYLSRVKAKYTAAGRPVRTRIELAQAAWADGYSTAERTTLAPLRPRELRHRAAS